MPTPSLLEPLPLVSPVFVPSATTEILSVGVVDTLTVLVPAPIVALLSNADVVPLSTPTAMAPAKEMLLPPPGELSAVLALLLESACSLGLLPPLLSEPSVEDFAVVVN